MNFIKKYWFLIGLALVSALTLADVSNLVADAGRWSKAHHGPDIVICLVFLFSGMMLDTAHIRAGLTDIRATIFALLLIFALAPLISCLPGILPLAPGIKIGLFLVAVMPTTMSSGVVMTGAAGGRMAHALVITVTANLLAVFTIPLTLPLLLPLAGSETAVVIDKAAVMIKIGFFVVLPLAVGLFLRTMFRRLVLAVSSRLQIANQLFILCIVWMGVSQSKFVLLEAGCDLLLILLAVSGFHLALLAAAWSSLRFLAVPAGRRESVLFMGIQKTLPLSVILQVTLFPQYGLALLVCVAHHFISLMIDGFLVGRLRAAAA
ncbi:MAG: bile acid:sodium symporter [Desulfosalsimonadaceae bacterium]